MSKHYISILDDKNSGRWDEYVMRCSEATFFHRAGWRTVIEQAFGHRAYFLFSEEDKNITGILPLGHIKSMLFGNALISVPFCVYGGVCSDSVETAQKLHQAAEDLAESLGVDYLELRYQKNALPDWVSKDLYVTFRKSIDPDPNQNLMAIPRKQRAMVRKGMKAGLHSEIDGDISRFFSAYSESVRNLGTPVFPKRYFRILVDTFGEDCEILTVTSDRNDSSIGELLRSTARYKV